MIYNWYKIFNLLTFEATDLPSMNLSVELEGVGVRDILVTKGNMVGVVYEDIFLPLGLGVNPFEIDSHAVYLDTSNDVWLGLPE